MIWSFSLHYLISQSLFIVRINYYRANGFEDPENSLDTLGYSVLAIICVLLIGGIGVVLIILVGFRHYPGLMPIGATCSAVIAAACWRPDSDTQAATQDVMWGELAGNNSEVSTLFTAANLGGVDMGEENETNVRHLCFTSFPVIEPQSHTLYM